MAWHPKYLQDSLFFEPWKTKYIEVFSREFCLLKKEYDNLNVKNSEQSNCFMRFYIEFYKTVLKILKNKLKFSGCSNIKFYSDVIHESEIAGLISNKETWYEVLLFLNQYHIENKNYKNFKYEYIDILEDFSERMKPLVIKTGQRDKEYGIYDNSYCLWGIKERFYKKIIKLFLSFESVKIVRICGSRVTQDYREFSDIDLISEGTYSSKEYAKFVNKLYALDTPYIIDINDIYKSSKPFIYRNVVRSNIFYNRNDYISDDYCSII